VKLRSAVAIILLVLIIDQALKIWIKTSHPLGPVMNIAGQKWAQLYFIENKGMAWGWEIGGSWGKMLLTLFRLVAVIFGTWYITKIVKQKYTRGFIVCAALIYAGALGNLIDSLFYGMIFDKGMGFDPITKSNLYYPGIAQFSSHGYASFLHGNVVDMLYFPMVHTTWPNWVPIVGGSEFEFFSPIFNIADASISVGVITLLVFQKRFLHKNETTSVHPTVETSSETSDQAHVI
jgi:signal peptidase II